MAGRPKHYKTEELIDRAITVFWSKGYTAASAQDLMSAMDIGQGSFYRSFPGGKKELYLKSLKQHLSRTIERFNRELQHSEDPIQFIKDFFKSISRRSTDVINNGCYFGNSIVEMSNLDDETKLVSSSQLNKMKDSLEKVLSNLQLEGILKTKDSPEVLALHLVNLWNGLNVTQRVYPNNTKLLDDLISMNLKLLK